jgi:acyl carrier protein
MTRARTSLVAEVGRLLSRSLNVEVPSAEVDLLGTGRIDSLALVELLATLEQRYKIMIDLDDVELADFRTVTAIANYVASRRADRRNSGGQLAHGSG